MQASRHLPAALVALAALAMAVHGPIAQLEHYHEFADTRAWLGLPHAADVLSNLAFALVAAWAAARFRAGAWRERLGQAVPGLAVFVAALALTAAGSSYYHWAPDNARLVWDRLPIALACAGLLAAVDARHHAQRRHAWRLGALVAFAAASVAWWWWTESRGAGDLRPYLLLQCAPLVVIPLWQAQARAPSRERLGFALAIALYVVAKILELQDAAILEATGFVSGHTLKHLAAAAAAAVIVASLGARRDQVSTRVTSSPPRWVWIPK